MSNQLKLSDVVEILTVAFTQWPHIRITEPLARLWHESFKTADKDLFWQATAHALKFKQNDYPLTIGEVNKSLCEILKRMKPSNLTDSQAWSHLHHAIVKFGKYNQPLANEYLKTVDPKLNDAIALLGWQKVCAWHQKDEPINRAHFFKIYNQLSEIENQKISSNIPMYLDGLKQLENKTQNILD